MKIAKISIVMCLAVLTRISALAASGNAGTSAAQFLKLGAGSRAGALAETYTAMADDVFSGYYNPAGLTRLERPEFAGQYVSYFQDLKYNYVAFAYPLSFSKGYAKHAFGFSVYNLSVTDMERRTEDTDNPAGFFDASDAAFALSYGYRVRNDLGVGVTAKYIREKIDDVSASAFGADFGAHYRPFEEKAFDIGLAVRNVGTRIDFGSGGDPLPLGVALGVSYASYSGLTVALEGTKYRDSDIYGSVGAEYKKQLMENFMAALRAGYTTHYKDVDGLKGVAAGAGITYMKLSLDFAWVPYGDLGNTFRYTLAVRF